MTDLTEKEMAAQAQKTCEVRHNFSALQAAVAVAQALPEPPAQKYIDFLVDLREEYDRLRGVSRLENGNAPFFQCQNCGEVYRSLEEFPIRIGTESQLSHIKCHCGALCYPQDDLPLHAADRAEGSIPSEGRTPTEGPPDGTEGQE